MMNRGWGFLAMAVLFTVPFTVALTGAACGGSKTPPKDPESTTETTDETSSAGNADSGSPATASTAEKKEPAIPGEKPSTPCTGFEVDLIRVLAQASCENNQPKPEKGRDVKDLEVKVVPSAAKVAPGGKIDLTIYFANKGKQEMPLDFTVDPEPRFEIEVYDAKGKRMDTPPGAEPSLPSSVMNAPVPEKKIARATFVQAGGGHAKITWQASRRQWAPKNKVKGAVPGRGYPTVAGAPLPRGKYTLKVITPLVGINEGIERELSQPTLQLEVAP